MTRARRRKGSAARDPLRPDDLPHGHPQSALREERRRVLERLGFAAELLGGHAAILVEPGAFGEIVLLGKADRAEFFDELAAWIAREKERDPA